MANQHLSLSPSKQGAAQSRTVGQATPEATSDMKQYFNTNLSQNGSPNAKQGSPGKKRALPIQQKHLVYNEWGAIIQHQDEMDRAMKA